MEKHNQAKLQHIIRSSKQFIQVELKHIGVYSYDKSIKINDAKFTQFPVYQGLNNQTGEKVGIEVIHNQHFSESQDQFTEISAIRYLNEAFVLKYHDIFITKNNHYFISEIWDSNLLDLLHNNKFLCIPQAFKYFVQIFNAIYHIYSNDIIHMSLHPNNIVMKNGCCKLAGYRLFKEKKQFIENPLKQTKHFKNNPNQFSSPQLLKCKKYCQKCIVWSLGALLLFMITGETPNNSPLNNFKEAVKRTAKLILDVCLQIEQNKRATLQHLKSIIYQGQKPISLKLIQNALPKQAIRSQGSAQQVFRNQIDYIYFLERLNNLIKSCRPLGFSQNLEYLLQFNIRTVIKQVECFLEKYPYSGNQAVEIQLFDSLFQQFTRVKQQYNLQIKKNVAIFSNQRIKLFDRKDYSFSQSLNMQLQAILRGYIQDLDKLVGVLSSQQQVINHQHEILLLDFLVTYFQLNALIIEHKQNRKCFAELSHLEEIVQAPILINLKVYQMVKEKLNILHLK